MSLPVCFCLCLSKSTRCDRRGLSLSLFFSIYHYFFLSLPFCLTNYFLKSAFSDALAKYKMWQEKYGGGSVRTQRQTNRKLIVLSLEHKLFCHYCLSKKYCPFLCGKNTMTSWKASMSFSYLTILSYVNLLSVFILSVCFTVYPLYCLCGILSVCYSVNTVTMIN